MSLKTPMRKSGVPTLAAAPHILAGMPEVTEAAQIPFRNPRLESIVCVANIFFAIVF